MPLVPPASSSLFRPISHDKPWHTLLNASHHLHSSSTITPPESSRSQQSPPPSPPRSVASSTSTSSISVSLEPPATITPQYHTSVSSANNQSAYSAPPKHTDAPSEDQVTPQESLVEAPSPRHVVRFTADHITIGEPQGIRSRKIASRGMRDLGLGSEDEYSSGKPRNEVVRIRPTHAPTKAVETPSIVVPREDGLIVRDQHDLIADLQDLSNMLTDHVDVTKGFTKSPDRGRRPGSRFIKRILARVRPTRGREREKVAAEQAAVAAAAEAAVRGDIRYSSGIRNATDEMRQLVTAEEDVYGDYGDELDDEYWSESELQTLSGGKRQYVGFTRRNDTDIEAMHVGMPALHPTRSSRLRGDPSWRPRGGRRRSMDQGGRREEGGKLTRMSKSSVVVGKEWEDLSKGRSRLRLRMKGSHMDRRADRYEVEGRSGDVWGRWREDVGRGREQSVTSLPAGDFSRELITRSECSFRSTDSPVGALSVSSVTQASRNSGTI